MSTDMEYRSVDRIEISEGSFIRRGGWKGDDGSRLEFRATYHGDRDEQWIVRIEADGTEAARWNASKVLAIYWAAEQGKGEG